ncbi:hypothetical protein C9F11_20160 [Streptomyces sp. YIM 121038]|uniref:hypothetical protein n=1 Tax=Streptomyces sp. YIM 121038 TaxID=2136401 RepID=UPI0011102ADA|nr:hypothetical protein [Streptomyces sp. YIM 121038]QCX77667.1 hypothetical protein C9F11_20160 [Streptomyces sp. YIM 121038]
MLVRITAPVPGFTGEGPAGLTFTDGVAETSDIAVIGYCQGAGYVVERLDDSPAPPPDPQPTNAPQTKPAGRSPSRSKTKEE